jgi:hypothetical protein
VADERTVDPSLMFLDGLKEEKRAGMHGREETNFAPFQIYRFGSAISMIISTSLVLCF